MPKTKPKPKKAPARKKAAPKKAAAKKNAGPVEHDTKITTDGRTWSVQCACGMAVRDIGDHDRADELADLHEPGSSARHHGMEGA
jgi:hypothetical protein